MSKQMLILTPRTTIPDLRTGLTWPMQEEIGKLPGVSYRDVRPSSITVVYESNDNNRGAIERSVQGIVDRATEQDEVSSSDEVR